MRERAREGGGGRGEGSEGGKGERNRRRIKRVTCTLNRKYLGFNREYFTITSYHYY